MRQLITVCAGLVLVVATPTVICAQEPDNSSVQKKIEEIQKKVLPINTMGGRQFWGDVQFFQGWKIQQNVLTKHYRLLNSSDQRYESGTLEECQKRLEEIKQAQQLKPMQGKAVILIHGIIRSSKSFEKMKRACQKTGRLVVPFDYPSTQCTIPENAKYLEKVINSLKGIEEIELVVHSMGGLVVRSWIAQQTTVDPRIKRMVMLGVPNRGANMADRFRSNLLFKVIFGPAGQQLVTEANSDFITALPTPPFPFGIVAGGRNTLKGYNPLIPGDNDGTVGVSSTRLPGAVDFILVPVLHSFMMNDPSIIEHTLFFLKTETFRESGKAQPIPITENKTVP
ncbi:alpha/beta fold hydrolase [Gimesia aquarii]|uniref:Alpha/beta hydrolase family protein n=1 Tax=Gimesia aquarii TaxID=2527964 RepID=A0A517WT51_9PLAN|nr:alpha/beta fold hydrolase [Gimesia aquarii]QDU08433.1 Alpha/beta hydrolase family protein [Gimesia aquarii]